MRDLSAKEDLQEIVALISEADLVITNFKAGAAEKLGVSFDQLKSMNSRLIYASVNAYGE